MKTILKIITIILFLSPIISKAENTHPLMDNPFLNFKALKNVSAEEIKALIDQGYDVNETDDNGFTILHVMVNAKRKDIVALLIKAGADVNAVKTRGGSALHDAAYKNHPEIAQLLIDAGADIEAKNRHGETPLHRTAWQGSVETLHVLLQAGADVNILTTGWIRGGALHYAALRNHPAIAQILIDAGADIDAKTDYGATPLRYAAQEGNTGVARILLEAGANQNARKNDGSTTFMAAANYGRKPSRSLYGYDDYLDETYRRPRASLKMLKLLIEYKADPHAVDNEGKNAREYLFPGEKAYVINTIKYFDELGIKESDKSKNLFYNYAKMETASAEEIQNAIDQGADINEHRDTLVTTLHAMVLSKRTDIIALLIKAGADVNIPDNRGGDTPLHAAAILNLPEIAQLLINAGADIEASGSFFFYPLHSAAQHGSIDVMRILLKAGADVNGGHSFLTEPLNYAVSAEKIEAVRILLEAGADANIYSTGVAISKGKALSRAAYNNSPEIAKLLIEAGADVNATQYKDNTALSIAAWLGNIEVARILLEAGANVNARTKYGSTAFISAAKYNAPNFKGAKKLSRAFAMLKLLIEYGADPHAVDYNGKNARDAFHSYNNHPGAPEVAKYLDELGVK